MYKIYQVVSGDTIEVISSKFGISPSDLANLNGIDLNSNLKVGSYIVVPKGEEMFNKYVVQKGDNMYEIARIYDINPIELIKLNGLNNSDVIYPGDEILIPRASTGFYVTETGDTLNEVLNKLNLSLEELIGQNQNIFLVSDQLIVYRK